MVRNVYSKYTVGVSGGGAIIRYLRLVRLDDYDRSRNRNGKGTEEQRSLKSRHNTSPNRVLTD
jgi:hypothetical protein